RRAARPARRAPRELPAGVHAPRAHQRRLRSRPAALGVGPDGVRPRPPRTDDPPPRRPTMSGLRIIGGTFKGRRLLAPRGLETRPLPARVQQALFASLGPRPDGPPG